MRTRDARRLVNESGLPEPDEKGRWHLTINDLLRFASFVAQKEREQCAKQCDPDDFTFITKAENIAVGAALTMVRACIEGRSHPKKPFFDV